MVDIGVGKLPQLARDYTDRNRTSPFAFTGNKFEFRAVGSSQNVAAPMAVLVAAMADALEQMAGRLKAKLEKNGGRDAALLELLREVFTETTPVRFEGNNYSEEWKLEAGRRGLPNHPTRRRRSRCCATPGAPPSCARPGCSPSASSRAAATSRSSATSST